MEQTAPLRPLPQLVFRVLILGRANAGKTSILQRVCETTESPKIYRVGSDGNRKKIQLEPTSQRGHHTITDEYIFANHRGYVFHDSCGFEGGDTKQWEEVQEFIHDRSTRKKLRDRLHAIWFCVPMDQHQRACLDIATFDKICPDKNVPVIVLFTKYEAFKSNMKINLEDEAEEKDVVIDDIEKLTQEECRKFFKNQCLRKIGSAPYVQLEKMHEDNQRCQELVDTTMAALNPAVVSLMLLAVQQGNVELSIRWAVRESRGDQDPVRKCLMGFPVLWVGDTYLPAHGLSDSLRHYLAGPITSSHSTLHRDNPERTHSPHNCHTYTPSPHHTFVPPFSNDCYRCLKAGI
ncbi:hypothetical protein C8R45DRAFT_1022136 [Mycena sanguinolenta]|nr:hypothetical protein C8R45DRAFT_1022136 [Mycena sanguinolenta]